MNNHSILSRVLALVLSITMIFATVPAPVLAADSGGCTMSTACSAAILKKLLASIGMTRMTALSPSTVLHGKADRLSTQRSQRWSICSVPRCRLAMPLRMARRLSGAQPTREQKIAACQNVEGTGTFEVVTGGSVANSGASNAIGNALGNTANSKVIVSGGMVSSYGNGSAIYGNNYSFEITVSGGTVEATGESDAIYSLGIITVNGGTVKNTVTGGENYAIHTGTRANAKFTINGGLVEIASPYGYAISSGTDAAALVTISGGEIRQSPLPGRSISKIETSFTVTAR